MTENPTRYSPAMLEAINPLSREEVEANRLLLNKVKEAFYKSRKYVKEWSFGSSIFTNKENSIHEIIINQVYYDDRDSGYKEIIPSSIKFTPSIFIFGECNYRQPGDNSEALLATSRNATLSTHVIGADGKPYLLQNIFLLNDLGQAGKIEVFRNHIGTPYEEGPSVVKLDFCPITNIINYTRATKEDRERIEKGLNKIENKTFVEQYLSKN